MNELHDQDRVFDEVPPYEPDWHQQDKDDRAQGMDREPEPPDDGVNEYPEPPGPDDADDEPWGELSDTAPF